jgi:eukaryotic-like serine/threonine-protein kinase
MGGRGGIGAVPAGGRARRSRELLAQFSPSASDEEQREFYQTRLALFARLFLWVFVIMLAWVNLVYWVFPGARPDRYMVINYVAGVGLVLLFLLWRRVLRVRRCSLELLFFLDMFIFVTIAAILALSAHLAAEKWANVYTIFVWTTFLVFGRVPIVPSSGRRTLALSAAAFVPILMAVGVIGLSTPDYHGTPGPLLFVSAVCFAVLAVLLAALGSWVIYGLRKQVRDAQRLGQYTLEEKIGQGGMGEVYRARHAMLRRPTALKLLRPEKAGRQMVARFEREVQLTSQLSHPNTVAIFDYGRSPEGVFYYVMEYLDGVDLEELVRAHGPQPAARVIHILQQICGSLAEAHDRRLVHRDVKPANVILCERGDVPDVIKVLDFGLVKDIEQSTELSTEMVAGTPSYLAPEVITEAEDIGPASDLYSLGGLAYFLLTGEVVFPAGSILEMCVHHVKSEPVPPRRRTDNPIPQELEDLILQCLLKEPEFRPRSARALREALLALPEAAEWTEEEARAWWVATGRGRAGREQDEPARIDPHGTTMSSPMTITVDLTGRADGDDAAAAADPG